MPYLIGAALLDPELQYCSSDPNSVARRRLHVGQPHDYPSTNTPFTYPQWFPDSNSHASDATNVTLSSIPPEGTHFCSTGTSYGDDRDLARCSVVQLLMNSYNMTGSIPATTTTTLNTRRLSDVVPPTTLREHEFTNLQSIDLGGNDLSGPFPMWITQLPALQTINMSMNQFDAVGTVAETMQAIADMCERTGVTCTDGGLPGFGGTCLAFSNHVVMPQPEDAGCYPCPSAEDVASQYYLQLFLPVVCIVALYVFLVYTVAQGGVCTRLRIFNFIHQGSLRRWVGCCCILIMHGQLIILMCGTTGVRNFWPAEVETFIACISLDYTCFVEVECVVDLTDNLTYHLEQQYSINNWLWVIMIFPPFLITFLVGFRYYFTWRRRRDLEKGIIRDRDTIVQKVVEGFHDFVLNTMPVFEFVCSILIPLCNAWMLRVTYQLVYWPRSTFPIQAILLLCSQPVIYILYGRDVAVAQVRASPRTRAPSACLLVTS